MTREEAIKRAEIAMAWARGDEVQARSVNGLGNWTHIYSADSPMRDPECPPAFFDLGIEWRIKPKPLECWMLLTPAMREGLIYQDAVLVRFSAPSPGDPRHGEWVRMVEPTE